MNNYKFKIISIGYFLCYLSASVVYGGDISGIVSNAFTKQPIEKATVYCSKDEYKKLVIKTGLTNSKGVYDIRDIPPDVYYVSVEK